MEKESAYLIGIHKDSFRCGIPAKITGVCFMTPGVNYKHRLVYEICFDDYVTDEVPLSDIENGNYKLVSFTDLYTGKWKEK
jgi:hypothetical protein